MKPSHSWIDYLFVGLMVVFTGLGVAIFVDAKYRDISPIAKPEIKPVAYCAVELIYRVEETPGQIAETSVCIESTFKWEEHIGQTSALYR
ncbi:MAG: hypothetical protein ACK4ML_00945 [Alishewanella aestuarii]